MKSKKSKTAVCGYCLHFREAGIKGAEVEGKVETTKAKKKKAKAIQSRKCKVVKKLVRENDPCCDKFELYKFFWCDRYNAWLDVKLCLSRQEKEKEGCVRCPQGKYLKEIVDG